VLAPPPPIAVLDVERVDEGFVLGLDLPLARREDLELGRRGDDLVVTVAGRRRVLALPGALRRCTVAGAALRDGRLAVTFVPDPALWPAGRFR
jgi:arsenite-transporting ATPase